jgi:hypothetical protein
MLALPAILEGVDLNRECLMKSLRAVIVIVIGFVAVLWWAVKPPLFEPELSGPVRQTGEPQCPAHSRLDGKLCVCEQGRRWNGAVCAPK